MKDQRTISTNCEVSGSSYWISDNDFIYSFYLKSKDTVGIVKINARTLEKMQDEFITVQDMDLGKSEFDLSGALLDDYYYFIKGNRSYSNGVDGLYCVNSNDLSDYKYLSFEDLFHFSPIGYESLSLYKFNLYNGDLYMVPQATYYQYSDIKAHSLVRYAWCIKPITCEIMAVRWKPDINAGWYNYPYCILPCSWIKSPYVLVSRNTAELPTIYLMIDIDFLSTINNLSTPVVKNETQTMKVTYEITEI